MSQLNIGVIGLGVGERHIAGYQQINGCQVVALCDTDHRKLEYVGARYPGCRLFSNPEDLLDNKSIDVVSIASYDDAHADQIVHGVLNKKHVFVEKPICLSKGEFSRICVALQHNPDIKFSSNLILRKVPRFQNLKRTIEIDEMGAIYYSEGDYDYGRIEKITHGWRSTISNYSVVHGGAIHLIDLILWCTGKKVIEVFSWGNRTSTKDSAFKNYDMVVSLLRFNDGSLAKITANFGSVTPHHHKVCFYGTRGTFIQTHNYAHYCFSRDSSENLEPLIDVYPNVQKGDMLSGFINSILTQGEPDAPAQDVINSMTVSLAIEQSLVSGQPQKVAYFNLRQP